MAEHQSVTTITGANASVIAALRRAAEIAAEQGHGDVICWEDLLLALLDTADSPPSPLEYHWKQRGFDALTLDGLRELARSIVPAGPESDGDAAEPATVTFEVTGPYAEEFRVVAERRP
ncbi:hypothetical protein ACWEO2_22190 [Nocardia sp. NPDC004278]|uniref:hypothetical protein n=1 Tax=Nocardia sp. NPDC005998 TaxID=3156894 RepID=UPI0033B4E74E